jgi:hypothetical protein
MIELNERVAQLEMAVLSKDELIAEQAQTIAEFAIQANRYALLEGQCLNQEQQLTQLKSELFALKGAPLGGFDVLAKGWMNSAIGRRINTIPEIDQSNMLVGIIFKDFEIIRTAYGHMLRRLAEMGKAATNDEQLEIRELMHSAGFV